MNTQKKNLAILTSHLVNNPYIFPSRDYPSCPAIRISPKPNNKSFIKKREINLIERFIDQACSVKMAGYWPRSVFLSLWTSTPSRSINSQNKNLANIQPCWPHTCQVNNPYLQLDEMLRDTSWAVSFVKNWSEWQYSSRLKFQVMDLYWHIRLIHFLFLVVKNRDLDTNTITIFRTVLIHVKDVSNHRWKFITKSISRHSGKQWNNSSMTLRSDYVTSWLFQQNFPWTCIENLNKETAGVVSPNN